MRGTRPACVVVIGTVCALVASCATTPHAKRLAPDRPQFIRHGPTAEYSRKTITDFWYSDDRLNRFEIIVDEGRAPASAIYRASLGRKSMADFDPAGTEAGGAGAGAAAGSGGRMAAAGEGAASGFAVGMSASGAVVAGACSSDVGEGALIKLMTCVGGVLVAPIVIVGGTAVGAAVGGIGGSDRSGSVSVQPATHDQLARSATLEAGNGLRLLDGALQGQHPTRSIAKRIHAAIVTRTNKYSRVSTLEETSGSADHDDWADVWLAISLDRLDLVALEEEIVEGEPHRFRLFIQVVTGFETVGRSDAPHSAEVIGYLGPAHPLDELEADEGHLFQREIDQGFRALAQYIALGHYEYQPPRFEHQPP